MSLTVKINARSPMLQGGDQISGVVSNDKEFVWGELSGTYVTAGVPFSTANIGLSDSGFDFIQFQPVTLNGGTGYTATTQLNASHQESTSLLIMQTVDINGTITDATQTAYVVNFFACGTSSKVANLT
jgi:hypothetical protein